MSTAAQFTTSDISEFYDQNFPKIYKYFYYKLFSVEAAEDLTSETFLAFAEALNNQKIDNPRGFLYGIAYRRLQEHLREKYRLPTSDVDYEIADKGAEVDSFLLEVETSPSPEDMLLKYLPMLPTQQREIVELRIVQRLSLGEICEQIGKDMSYVKTTQNRAIKKLKQLIAGIPPTTDILEENYAT